MTALVVSNPVDIALAEGNLDFDILADALGLRSGGTMLPSLKINLAPDIAVDVDGIKKTVSLTRGTFYVRHDGDAVYSQPDEPVIFRAFLQRTDYREYDATANGGKGAFIKRSILAGKGEEPLDDSGMIACCKLRGLAAKQPMSAEQQLIQQRVKTCRVVFGTVSYTGKTALGKTVEIKELPVELRLQGSNYMGIEDFWRKAETSRLLPLSIPLTLTTDRQQKGSTVYYVIQYDYNMTNRVPATGADALLVKQFLDHISVYNAEILTKHKEALRARSADPYTDKDGLDADFGSEV